MLFRSRVSTIYSAPDPSFTGDKKPGDDQILDRYSIKYPYILYAGTIRPRKNIPRLVEAFAVLRHELAQHPTYKDLKLVLIGDEHSKYPAVRRAVALTRTEAAVRFLGFVPLDTLRVFYRNAELFAFPSLYEGFGLAPLEAMACGTPVVAASVGGLRTAVDDRVSGLLVAGHDPRDFASAIGRIAQSQSLRSELSAGARMHASSFGWSATSAGLLQSYSAALANYAPAQRTAASTS